MNAVWLVVILAGGWVAGGFLYWAMSGLWRWLEMTGQVGVWVDRVIDTADRVMRR